MKEKNIIKKLEQEGFKGIFVHTDLPGAYYPEHTHMGITVHVVLEGEIAITMDGQTKTYNVGDRFDVPCEVTHSARVGKSGCRYIIGEK